MSTFFGFDEHNAQGFIENKIVCLPRMPNGRSDVHAIVSPIRHMDIVFIKYTSPESRLHIKAIGVVQSEFPTGKENEVCLPVDWVWQGEKVLENLDEVLALSANAVYEEHNIQVQRELTDLLPQKYQLSQKWQWPLAA
ncbi:MAG: hypothetical protein KJ850_09035 [Gammaproteobacteria bacterium]|nr:hypothetical protein [Gammaproteobacteria bacterium]MBU1625178.1 hypothetical protein [Gammaproteobacteria bacterium]MBU1981438.1 hypothetical protein [Gammaproteobacteria bacterium]